MKNKTPWQAGKEKKAKRLRRSQWQELAPEMQEVPIVKCCYCGKLLEDIPETEPKVYAKLHTRNQQVCSEECRQKTEEYLINDSKYKIFLFALIFIGGIGFIISAVFLKDQYKMTAAYIGQIIGGFALIAFPYPVISFATFQGSCMKRVTLLCRIFGIALLVTGLVFFVLMMKGVQ